MSGYPRPKIITGTTITRPADTTAYASGDLVANSTTAGSVVPITFANVVRAPGYRVRINRAGLFNSGAAVTNGTFNLYLFGALPTVTNGDNAAFSVASNGSSYIGVIQIVLDMAGAAGVGGWSALKPLSWLAGLSANIYGLLAAGAAYTPASAETLIPKLDVDQY